MSCSVDKYRLDVFTSQGNIRIKLISHVLLVELHRNTIISVNIKTGKVKFNPHGLATKVTARSFNRFLQNVDCKRYNVILRNGDYIFEDLKLRQKKFLFRHHQHTFFLPIKSLVKLYLILNVINQKYSVLFTKDNEEISNTYDEKNVSQNEVYADLPF